MTADTIKNLLAATLQKVTEGKINSVTLSSVGGGSINDTYKVTVNSGNVFFLKMNERSPFPDFFEKEKHGLEILRKENIIRVPEVVIYKKEESLQLFLLEWIEPGGKTENFWSAFGEQVAMLHSVSATSFGFETDNYMGALPQVNRFCDNWTDFFVQYRIMPQIKLGYDKSLLNKKHIEQFERLYPRLKDIFNEEKPALLHGDLWAGNFICDKNSLPVLIDPAVYYGHRSIDLGMTTLFGGFSQTFYDAYNYHYPFPGNYREQWEVCNLYPLLIHLNLFGSSYLSGIERTLEKHT